MKHEYESRKLPLWKADLGLESELEAKERKMQNRE